MISNSPYLSASKLIFDSSGTNNLNMFCLGVVVFFFGGGFSFSDIKKCLDFNYVLNTDHYYVCLPLRVDTFQTPILWQNAKFRLLLPFFLLCWQYKVYILCIWGEHQDLEVWFQITESILLSCDESPAFLFDDKVQAYFRSLDYAMQQAEKKKTSSLLTKK